LLTSLKDNLSAIAMWSQLSFCTPWVETVSAILIASLNPNA